MAKWIVVKTSKSARITYVNSITGATHNCGDQHIDTSARLMLDWAAANASPGDLLFLNDKMIAQKFDPAEA